MRGQVSIAIALAACGRGGDNDAADKKRDAKDCPASRFVVELADENNATMKALYGLVDKDKNAPKIGVYPQLDEWKDSAGVVHTDYRLAGSDRAIIASYVAAKVRADAKLAPAADRALRYEKTFASGKTYWRTHYVIAKPVIDGSAVQGAEVGGEPAGSQVIILLTPEGRTKLAATTAPHAGKKLAFRVGDTVLAAPVITASIDSDRAIVAMAEETPEHNAQVAAEIAKQLSCTK